MHFDPAQFPGSSLFWEILATYFLWMDKPVRYMLIGYVVIMLYFCSKGNKKEKYFYVLSFLVLVVICLNPWMCRYLIDKWNFFLRYFRFFWLIPVSMGYAYFLAKIYEKLGKKSRVAIYVVMAGLFVFSCVCVAKKTAFSDIYTGDVTNTGMIVVDNIYKVEDDIIESCDIIEKDSGDSSALKKTLYDRVVYLEIRTYDPSLIPVVNYGAFSTYDAATAIDNNDWYAIMSIFYTGQETELDGSVMNSELLKKAMSNIDCDYVMLYKSNPYHDIWTESFTCLGDAGRYIILKVR